MKVRYLAFHRYYLAQQLLYHHSSILFDDEELRIMHSWSKYDWKDGKTLLPSHSLFLPIPSSVIYVNYNYNEIIANNYNYNYN